MSDDAPLPAVPDPGEAAAAGVRASDADREALVARLQTALAEGRIDLDEYAEDCYDGDMGACDALYRESPRSSAYELYGGTCAGRQSNADASRVFCTDAFPPAS